MVPSSVLCAELLGMVFPHLEKVLVEQVVVESGILRLTAHTAR